jgi:4-oxalocrotonate tautomerase
MIKQKPMLHETVRDADRRIIMPILRVSLWTGRTKDQKAQLAKALTDTMVDVAKVPAEAVTIQFDELPQENWATGGKLHSELFKGRG